MTGRKTRVHGCPTGTLRPATAATGETAQFNHHPGHRFPCRLLPSTRHEHVVPCVWTDKGNSGGGAMEEYPRPSTSQVHRPAGAREHFSRPGRAFHRGRGPLGKSGSLVGGAQSPNTRRHPAAPPGSLPVYWSSTGPVRRLCRSPVPVCRRKPARGWDSDRSPGTRRTWARKGLAGMVVGQSGKLRGTVPSTRSRALTSWATRTQLTPAAILEDDCDPHT